jgi:hypothetical protein
MDWNLVKEELSRNYKKELYLWIVIVLFLGISLFLLMREYQNFTANLQKLKKVETSYYSQHQEIMKLKEEFKRVNLNATQRMLITPFSGVFDLKDLNRAISEVKALTQGEDHFLVIKELTLSKGKEKNESGGEAPKLKIDGEIVIFMNGGS